MAALKVTIEDTETGEIQTKEIPDNDFLIITTGICYVDGVQSWPVSGTTQLTIKKMRGE